MQLQTLLRNGSPLSPLFSIASALFLSPRGWYPLCGLCSPRLPRVSRGAPISVPSVLRFFPHLLVSAVICATQRLYPLWTHSVAHTSCHHGSVGCRRRQVLRTKLRLWSSLPRQSRTESTAIVTISKPAMAHA